MSREYYAVLGIKIALKEFDENRKCNKCQKTFKSKEDNYCSGCGEKLSNKETFLSSDDEDFDLHLCDSLGDLDYQYDTDGNVFIGYKNSVSNKGDTGIVIPNNYVEKIRQSEIVLELKEHSIKLYIFDLIE